MRSKTRRPRSKAKGKAGRRVARRPASWRYGANKRWIDLTPAARREKRIGNLREVVRKLKAVRDPELSGWRDGMVRYYERELARLEAIDHPPPTTEH